MQIILFALVGTLIHRQYPDIQVSFNLVDGFAEGQHMCFLAS